MDSLEKSWTKRRTVFLDGLACFSYIGWNLELVGSITIYIPHESIDGTEMRISFVDSCLNGFKKWSDAQQAKSEPAATVPDPDQAEHRASAAWKEAASDAGC